MWVILLEALFALLLIVGIVWWTMFSGRKGGEPPQDANADIQNAEVAKSTQKSQKDSP